MKIKEIQDLINKNEIDLLFLMHPDKNIDYLTQEHASYSILIINPNNADFIVSKLDNIVFSKDYNVKILSKNWSKELFSKKVKKVAINKNSLTVNQLEKLQTIYPNAEFIDFLKELNHTREIKIDSEVKRISKACEIVDNALHSFVKDFSLEKFSTELSIARYLENNIKMANAKLSFPIIVANKENSAIPHHKPSDKVLEPGFLLIDIGACYQGYCSDMTRMFYLGDKITEEEQGMFDLLLNCQNKTIQNIELGKDFSQLSKDSRKELKQWSSYFIHSLGHGIGVEVHESPKVSIESTQKIKSNSVFTIEPGIYFPGKFGLRIEDTVHFNEKIEVLTNFPKNLTFLL